MTSESKYNNLTDLEKLQKQWHKLSGLHNREEWSAAMVRAATAAEIAANFAIRKEFEARSDFEPDFVSHLLQWANGLDGKISKLLIPLSKNQPEKLSTLRQLKKIAEKINGHRNEIVHRGEFRGPTSAQDAIANAENFITSLVRLYDTTFELKDRIEES